MLERLGVRRFAPLTYPHKPGMGRWLTEWAGEFADAHPDAVRTATLYPEPDVADYLGAAVEHGARIVKSHVQVGRYDPRDPLLRDAWGLLAEAGVPAIVHCGDGPIPGKHTGLDVFGEVLAAHPRLRVVIAHAGLPDFTGALELLRRHENVLIDTTMVGTAFTEAMAPLPADWPARLAEFPGRVVLGHRLPEHPLPLRRAAADDPGVGGRGRPARARVPALGAARRTRRAARARRHRTGMIGREAGVMLGGPRGTPRVHHDKGVNGFDSDR